MKTDELMRLLRARYSEPSFQVLEQVANGTGAQRHTRWADALAMGLWPSRGLHLHGFELKVSRGDFLREMKQPAKADDIASRCHFWWIVAGDERVARPEELPPTWGLLVAQGEGLVVKKAAPQLEPGPLSYEFLASLMRSMGRIDAERLQAQVNEAMHLERQQHRLDMEAQEKRLEYQRFTEVGGLRHLIDEFHRTSGVNLQNYRWSIGEVGEAVRTLVAGGRAEQRRRLEQLSEALNQMQQRAQAALTHIQEEPHGQAPTSTPGE